jgi:hypothetical protein
MAVKWGITDQGALFKNTGKHSTYGVANTPNIAVDKTTAANPSPKIQQRIQEQKQLCIDIQRETSGVSIQV